MNRLDLSEENEETDWYGSSDCHNNKTQALEFPRWTLQKAEPDTGIDSKQAARQEASSLVCAECHVTYIVHKDAEMKNHSLDESRNPHAARVVMWPGYAGPEWVWP